MTPLYVLHTNLAVKTVRRRLIRQVWKRTRDAVEMRTRYMIDGTFVEDGFRIATPARLADNISHSIANGRTLVSSFLPVIHVPQRETKHVSTNPT